jgi:hypothetical protein
MPSIPEAQPLPEPKPLAAPQQAKPAPVVAPPPVMPVQKQAPLPKQVDAPTPAPPPVLVQGDEMEPTVKRKKTKRKEVQQASKGTAALTIPLNTDNSAAAGGSTGGLNIPK